MNFDEFTGEAQHRLELSGTGEALRSTRATLMPLGQRISEGEATDLAAALPMEIDWYLTGSVDEHGQRFGWDEYVSRVSEIEDVEEPDAAYHAQVIMDLVAEQAPGSEIEQVRQGLPEDEDDEDWGQLFEVIDAGGWSEAEESDTGGGPEAEQ